MVLVVERVYSFEHSDIALLIEQQLGEVCPHAPRSEEQRKQGKHEREGE